MAKYFQALGNMGKPKTAILLFGHSEKGRDDAALLGQTIISTNTAVITTPRLVDVRKYYS